MAVNTYLAQMDDESTSEVQLWDDLSIEFIQAHGMDIKYLPKTPGNYDAVFKEDALRSFKN
jgi:hypothetical protein